MNDSFYQIAAAQNETCYSSDVTETWKLVKLSVQLSYILPFTVIYIKFLVSIAREKSTYSDSFFTLYIADGIYSVCSIFFEYSVVRLVRYITPYCEWLYFNFKEPTYLLTPYYFTHLFFQFMKAVSTVTLSANRFTSVVVPLKHERIWRTHIRHVIVSQIVISAIATSPILTGPAYAFVSKNEVSINYVHNIPYFRSSNFRVMIMVPSLVFIILANFTVVSRLSGLSQNMRRIEISMFISTIFLSIGFVVVLGLSFVILLVPSSFYFEQPHFLETFVLFSQVSNDFYIISGPIVLLILDRNIRRTVFNCYRERSNSIVQVQSATEF